MIRQNLYNFEKNLYKFEQNSYNFEQNSYNFLSSWHSLNKTRISSNKTRISSNKTRIISNKTLKISNKTRISSKKTRITLNRTRTTLSKTLIIIYIYHNIVTSKAVFPFPTQQNFSILSRIKAIARLDQNQSLNGHLNYKFAFSIVFFFDALVRCLVRCGARKKKASMSYLLNGN